MKLIINGAAYGCAGRPSLRDPVRFNLPGGQPDPAALGEVLSLRDNEGTVLREISVADYTRWYVSGAYLVGTNAPEPAEPVEPEPAAPSADEDQNALLVDHEYRLTLLELGVL